jgi:adenylate kinase
MNSPKIIFLGGIHGVGKGSFSKSLTESLNLKYLSASKLLKWENFSSDVKNKKVASISETQENLLNALHKICSSDTTYLLDGHFCLLNIENEPTIIEIEIFRNINPILFLVMKEDVRIIRNRLKKRDNKNYELERLHAMQSMEISHAKSIAKELNKPFFEIDINNFTEIINNIKKLL